MKEIDAGGRKKVAHPGHREPNVGHRTCDWGGPLGHRRLCKLWQVPEKERYVHKQAQVKVLESSGPLGHKSQPPPSFVDASPCLRLMKVSTRVEMNAEEHHGSGGPASGPQSLKPHAWWPLLHLVGLLWMALAKTGASG